MNKSRIKKLEQVFDRQVQEEEKIHNQIMRKVLGALTMDELLKLEKEIEVNTEGEAVQKYLELMRKEYQKLGGIGNE